MDSSVDWSFEASHCAFDVIHPVRSDRCVSGSGDDLVVITSECGCAVSNVGLIPGILGVGPVWSNSVMLLVTSVEVADCTVSVAGRRRMLLCHVGCGLVLLVLLCLMVRLGLCLRCVRRRLRLMLGLMM